jgi:ABC-type transporter Mla subunit MlaD
MNHGTSLYFKLGLFMIIGVSLLAAGVILLGAGKLFQETIPAETLVYDSVNGLDVGSAVKYRGVKIGQVSSIIFSSAKYGQAGATTPPAGAGRNIHGILIEMALTRQAFPGQSVAEIESTTKELVSQGLRARVTPAGISGQSYVECDFLDPAQYPPPPIDWHPDILYVPSAPSPLGELLDAAGDVAAQLDRADLGGIAHHIDELVSSSKSTVDKVDQLVQANRNNLDRTLAQLPETAQGLKATAARADQILNDPRVDKALSSFSGVGDSANAAIADIRRLARDADELLDGESDDIRSIFDDLRRLAADGAAVTDDARQNPSRVLFGKPPPTDRPQ